MNNLFHPNGILSKAFTLAFDVIGLSICWLICCIPLLTPGVASAGLYYAIDQYTLEKQEGALKGFVKYIKENYKQGILVYLIVLLIGLFILWSMWISYQMMIVGSLMGRVIFYFGGTVLFFYLGYLNYLFSVMATYSYATKDLFMVSLQLCIMHLPSTIILAVISILSILGIYYFWVLLFFWPALYTIIQRNILVKIFAKHQG